MNISRFLWLMLLLVAIPNSRGTKEDSDSEYYLETIPKLSPGPTSTPGPETTNTPEPVTTTAPKPVTTYPTTYPTTYQTTYPTTYQTTFPEPETTTTPEPSTPEPSTPVPVQCNIPGKCKGSVISYSFTNDQTECLNQCKHYFPTPYQHNCKWITFDADTGLCELFEDCSPTDPGDCSYCISSEVRCETEADPDNCYVPGNCQVYIMLKVFQIEIFSFLFDTGKYH